MKEIDRQAAVAGTGSYHQTVSTLSTEPEQLELLYRAAQEAGEADAFKEAIDANHAQTPENLLYAAWFHRLQYAAAQATTNPFAWAAAYWIR